MLINFRDLTSGAVLVAVGAIVSTLAITYEVGTFARMRAGFFPLVLGILLIALGGALVVAAIGKKGPPIGFDIRAMGAVSAGITLFAVAAEAYGLMLASLLAVGASSLGSPKFRVVPALVLAVTATLGVWLIFKLGLGISAPMVRN